MKNDVSERCLDIVLQSLVALSSGNLNLAIQAVVRFDFMSLVIMRVSERVINPHEAFLGDCKGEWTTR